MVFDKALSAAFLTRSDLGLVFPNAVPSFAPPTFPPAKTLFMFFKPVAISPVRLNFLFKLSTNLVTSRIELPIPAKAPAILAE